MTVQEAGKIEGIANGETAAWRRVNSECGEVNQRTS